MSACTVGMCGTRPVSRTLRPSGLCHRSSCHTFKPRSSSPRLCRKARSQSLSCTATSAARPTQPGQPTAIHRAAATILSFWQHSLKQVAGFVRRQPTQMDSAEINAQIRSSIKNMKCLAAVAPLAAISASGSTNTFILITNAVGSFIRLYLLFLFLRVLLSWFPAFGWDKQPWLALRQVTDPYLNLFRGLVPPLLGTIDFTPLFGFMILQFLAGALDIGAEDDW
ncbi:hypothetical protein ABBQ32_008477 [Trebouxia sp. C0010 RCD-2024]